MANQLLDSLASALREAARGAPITCTPYQLTFGRLLSSRSFLWIRIIRSSLYGVVFIFSSRDAQLTQCLDFTPRWRNAPWWRQHSRCFCFLHSMHFSMPARSFTLLNLTSQSANRPTSRCTVTGSRLLILFPCKNGTTRYDLVTCPGRIANCPSNLFYYHRKHPNGLSITRRSSLRSNGSCRKSHTMRILQCWL